MHLVDELSVFLNVLEQNRVRARSIKQQFQSDSPSSNNADPDDVRITVCVFSSTTFTLAVIDGLEDAIINLSTTAPPPPILPEAELEPVMRDTSESNIVVDLVTVAAPLVAGTAKVEPPPSPPSINIVRENSPTNGNLSRGFSLFGQKKNKVEETIQRGLDIASKGSRGSSQTSLATMSDNGDDTLSQYDQLSEELDLDPVFLNNDTDQQQEKAARIELDDDSISLAEKSNANMIVIGTNALESVSLFFHKEKSFVDVVFFVI